MCEILIRIVDKINEDRHLNTQLLKRGDVVCAVEDGHQWSEYEKQSPEWRVLKLPLISVDEVQSFLIPQVEIDVLNPSRLLQRRAIKMNIDNLPKIIKDKIQEGSRTDDKVLYNVDIVTFASFKEVKPYLTEVDIFNIN